MEGVRRGRGHTSGEPVLAELASRQRAEAAVLVRSPAHIDVSHYSLSALQWSQHGVEVQRITKYYTVLEFFLFQRLCDKGLEIGCQEFGEAAPLGALALLYIESEIWKLISTPMRWSARVTVPYFMPSSRSMA